MSGCAFQSMLSWNCYQSNDKYSIVVLLYIFGNIKKGSSWQSVQWVSSSWINTLGKRWSLLRNVTDHEPWSWRQWKEDFVEKYLTQWVYF